MSVCQECRKFFVWDGDEKRGDCVQRVIDARQAYYKARPVAADQNASQCRDFEQKDSLSR